MKTLVVYYSYTQKTAWVAKAIAAELKADIRPIEDLKRPSMFRAFVAGGFAAMKGKTWDLKPMDLNLKDYDMIYVGSPVWANAPAPPLNTFLENTEFSGKKVAVFVTMGGSDGSKAISRISEKIVGKGGKVIGCFAARSGGQSVESLTEKAREALKAIAG